MALVVEAGTGTVGAESYISVAEADLYHASYGNTDWATIAEETKELLLRRASRDIDIIYGTRYDSTVLTSTQGLYWPRYAYWNAIGFEVTGVPAALKAATAELALIEKDGSVITADTYETNIRSSTKKLGDIQKTVEYFSPNIGSASNLLTRVTALLRPILGASSAMYATVVR